MERINVKATRVRARAATPAAAEVASVRRPATLALRVQGGVITSRLASPPNFEAAKTAEVPVHAAPADQAVPSPGRLITLLRSLFASLKWNSKDAVGSQP